MPTDLVVAARYILECMIRGTFCSRVLPKIKVLLGSEIKPGIFDRRPIKEVYLGRIVRKVENSC